MAEAGAAGDGEKSGFRWLDLARYAIAAVVTVVIIAVVVNSIKVVFRPDSLILSVLGGSVYTTATMTQKVPSLTFVFSLRALNPTGRVRMHYLDINVYLFNSSTKETTQSPMEDCLVTFSMEDMSPVMPMESVDTMKQATVQRDPADIMPFAFDALHKAGGSIKGVTMRVDGTLVTEVKYGISNSSEAVTYYCRQLVVGLYDMATMKTDPETICRTS